MMELYLRPTWDVLNSWTSSELVSQELRVFAARTGTYSEFDGGHIALVFLHCSAGGNRGTDRGTACIARLSRNCLNDLGDLDSVGWNQYFGEGALKTCLCSGEGEPINNCPRCVRHDLFGSVLHQWVF